MSEVFQDSKHQEYNSLGFRKLSNGKQEFPLKAERKAALVEFH